jgi:hypothetical protein
LTQQEHNSRDRWRLGHVAVEADAGPTPRHDKDSFTPLSYTDNNNSGRAPGVSARGGGG